MVELRWLELPSKERVLQWREVTTQVNIGGKTILEWTDWKTVQVVKEQSPAP